MHDFVNDFNPRAYKEIACLGGNENVTLMLDTVTKRQIVRKRISGSNRALYMQMAQIVHENLVYVFGWEEVGDCFYTYEEYINGTALDEIPMPVPEKQARDWIGQLCRAVRVLHEQSPVIIHRDIKPGNIMLTSDGMIKLIDFDAAKEFSSRKGRDTELIGTPDYAAPEQYGFAVSDPRTDIYAIGILFHELLTGCKPNEGKAPYKGRYKQIIRSCIELDPARRYKSVRELERQLGLRGIGRFLGVVPGFRTGVWWKKAVAVLFYITVVVCAVSTVNEDPTFLLLGCFAVTFVPLYLLLANPLRFRERLPLIKSKSIPVKIAGIMLYLLMWLLLFVIVSVAYAEGTAS